MAEIVGLVASIATLAEVAGKTGRTISRIRRLHASSPRYIETAQIEIEGFTAALNIIQEILESQQTPPPKRVKLEIVRLHAQATVALQEFDNFLQRKVLRGGSDGGSISLKRRAIVKEILGEAQGEFNEFQQQLVSIKLNLQLVLQALQLHYHQSSSWTLQRVSVVQAGVTTTVEAGHHDVTTALVEQAVATSAAAMMSSPGMNNDCILFEMQTPGRCRSQCPCQCHIGLQGSTPRWLRSLIGTVFYDLSGVPLISRRACNFKLCGGLSSGAARVQYALPTWILPCAIEATASWHNLSGSAGTWSVRVPRYIKNIHLFNRFHWLVRHGTLAEFQEAMSASGTRAFDVFDSKLGILSTLFALAVCFHRPDICEMLLQAGTDVSYRDSYGVSLAELFWFEYTTGFNTRSLSKHPKLIEAYDTSRILPGHDLLINNRLDALVAHLNSAPISVLLDDHYGFTLLHWASKLGNIDAVQILIAAGADINARCKRGQTPLMVMGMGHPQRSLEVCKMLLLAGADVNITDLDNANALMLILDSAIDNCSIVELLLDAGTNLHHVTDDDVDALEYLALLPQGFDDAHVCTLLLDHGITPSGSKNSGNNAAVLAILQNKHDMLEVLIQRGAALNTIESNDSITNITRAAVCANVRTMNILRDARIQGLPMDSRTVEEYWDLFDLRDEYFIGVRDSNNDERAAFQELLDSIIPMGPEPLPSPLPEKHLVPGAFPEDEDDSSYAESTSDSDDMEGCSAQDIEDSLDASGIFSDDEDDTLDDDIAIKLPSCQHQAQVPESLNSRQASAVC